MCELSLAPTKYLADALGPTARFRPQALSRQELQGQCRLRQKVGPTIKIRGVERQLDPYSRARQRDANFPDGRRNQFRPLAKKLTRLRRWLLRCELSLAPTKCLVEALNPAVRIRALALSARIVVLVSLAAKGWPYNQKLWGRATARPVFVSAVRRDTIFKVPACGFCHCRHRDKKLKARHRSGFWVGHRQTAPGRLSIFRSPFSLCISVRETLATSTTQTASGILRSRRL